MGDENFPQLFVVHQFVSMASDYCLDRNLFEIRCYFSNIASSSADTAVNLLKTADAPLSKNSCRELSLGAGFFNEKPLFSPISKKRRFSLYPIGQPKFRKRKIKGIGIFLFQNVDYRISESWPTKPLKLWKNPVSKKKTDIRFFDLQLYLREWRLFNNLLSVFSLDKLNLSVYFHRVYFIISDCAL